MADRYSELMFTSAVKRLQEVDGSRTSYARFEKAGFPARDRLGQRETEFIALRDSFYLASVSETGWPYIQHRGGPPGFVKVLDDRTLGLPDYPGNRQFISFGNVDGDDRVSLFLMDYPHRRRLKILGHARLIERATEPALLVRLGAIADESAERGLIISIEAFDWNCPKYITQRFTLAELDRLGALMHALVEGEG